MTDPQKPYPPEGRVVWPAPGEPANAHLRICGVVHHVSTADSILDPFCPMTTLEITTKEGPSFRVLLSNMSAPSKLLGTEVMVEGIAQISGAGDILEIGAFNVRPTEPGDEAINPATFRGLRKYGQRTEAP